MTQVEAYKIIADSAYEEHMKQKNNVLKEPTDCPYYNAEKAISEGERNNERINLCVQNNMEISHN